MLAIYIHIPFCKSRCAYCDFFSTISLEKRSDYVNALLKEIDLRQSELVGKVISSIYFGGGTPSVLETSDVTKIINKLKTTTAFAKDIEITLEANPGDITKEKLIDWLDVGINRLSVGVQSFNDHLLKSIGRRHNAKQAKNAILLANERGFSNISIDLIYGLPTQTFDEWKWELSQVLGSQKYANGQQVDNYIPSLPVTHISTYCLSYEEGTQMYQKLHEGEIAAVDDDTENEMYDYLVNTLKDHGFDQYEVSNFCKSGLYSHHNMAYWTNIPYCGIGAGAHSYDGICKRSWNINNLNDYISTISAGNLPSKNEVLSSSDQYNELVMLRLRTSKGLDLSLVPEKFADHLKCHAKPYLAQSLLTLEGNQLKATLSGIHILNRIIEDLMI